jgi:hypothetical protein
MQEAMKQFYLKIICQKGIEMPADFLSRNVVEVIQADDQMEKDQENKECIEQIKAWVLNITECKDPRATFLKKNYWANKLFY